jgi:hypothetical protein
MKIKLNLIIIFCNGFELVLKDEIKNFISLFFSITVIIKRKSFWSLKQKYK